MSYATRRRRHDLTLGDKMEVVRLIDNRTSQTDVAKIYNCSQSQISRIVSRRDEILADWETCDDPEQKKRRYVTEDDDQEEVMMKDETVQTLTDQSTSPRPPSENIFDGSEQSQTPDASNNGWLEYWKNHSASYGRRSYGDMDPDFSPWNRHFGSGSGGKKGARGRPRASANKESRISNQLLDILKNYDLCDVYCADELALHYNAMPNLDSAEEEEEEGDSDNKKDPVRKTNHKQITVFLTCNVTGSDKRDFLVIEDSKRSEATTAAAIPGCHRARAPHAWMTSDVFTEYLQALDYDMRRQQRYILLLVDNAPPHLPEAGKSLEHIRILYVRSYSTPFFHGIFYSVRAHYRKQILLKLFAHKPKLPAANGESKGSKSKRRGSSQGSTSGSVSVDFEDAVGMLKEAWRSVSPLDVVQCFSKAGLCAPHIHGLPEGDGDALPELPDGLITDEQYEEFVNVDVDAECSGDADLVSAECRILADLRQQGFTDVGLEPSDDLPLPLHPPLADAPALGASGSSGVSGHAPVPSKTPDGAASAAVVKVEARPDRRSAGEVQRALTTLRNFLERRGLHLHNLHALEAQISCDAGGH